MTKNPIPVFFACDDKYFPFMGIALHSLILNSDKNKFYDVYVLNIGLSDINVKRVLNMKCEHVNVTFVDVHEKMKKLGEQLMLRHYYSAAIYFRIFIPDMFRQFDKAIYLDSDIVVNTDIAKLYDIELGDNILGGTIDQVICSRPDFQDYATIGVGVHYLKYFNSGVLLMNLKKMREIDLEGQFVAMFNKYHFDVLCPDQDYLNVLTVGHTLQLDKGWNKMSVDKDYDGEPMIVHYNMFNKPWQYDDIPYGHYFWDYAKGCQFYDDAKAIKDAFGEKDIEMQKVGLMQLVEGVDRIVHSDSSMGKVLFSKEDK